jgi:hypothetical protein
MQSSGERAVLFIVDCGGNEGGLGDVGAAFCSTICPGVSRAGDVVEKPAGTK